MVVVTADHGENFGEHGLYLHGQSLYRPETHVSLIVFGPTGAPPGLSVAEPVSLRDLAPTLLAHAGGPGPAPFPGRSLTRFWETPTGAAVADPVLSEVALTDKVSRNPKRPPALRGPMASLIVGGHVYLRDAIGREELYDLKADPP